MTSGLSFRHQPLPAGGLTREVFRGEATTVWGVTEVDLNVSWTRNQLEMVFDARIFYVSSQLRQLLEKLLTSLTTRCMCGEEI